MGNLTFFGTAYFDKIDSRDLESFLDLLRLLGESTVVTFNIGSLTTATAPCDNDDDLLRGAALQVGLEDGFVISS